MPTLIATNGTSGEPTSFKCSDCDQLFSPPPVPRGARPWTTEEGSVKLAGLFKEHVEEVHREVNR